MLWPPRLSTRLGSYPRVWHRTCRKSLFRFVLRRDTSFRGFPRRRNLRGMLKIFVRFRFDRRPLCIRLPPLAPCQAADSETSAVPILPEGVHRCFHPGNRFPSRRAARGGLRVSCGRRLHSFLHRRSGRCVVSRPVGANSGRRRPRQLPARKRSAKRSSRHPPPALRRRRTLSALADVPFSASS